MYHLLSPDSIQTHHTGPGRAHTDIPMVKVEFYLKTTGRSRIYYQDGLGLSNPVDTDVQVKDGTGSRDRGGPGSSYDRQNTKRIILNVI